MSAVKFHSPNGSAVMTEGLEGRYRELLIRRLPGDGRPLVFCMLNPSTADHSADDPTIRRCIGFAMRENASALIVINLYAYRATNPSELYRHPPEVVIGPHNDETIRDVAVHYKRVVCAWGSSFGQGRAREVMQLFRRYNVETLCVGQTQFGKPRHPLYVRADQPLIPYTGD